MLRIREPQKILFLYATTAIVIARTPVKVRYRYFSRVIGDKFALYMLAARRKMEPKVISLGELKIIGLSYYGDNKNQEIGQKWDEFNKKWREYKKLYTIRIEKHCQIGTIQEFKTGNLKDASYQIGEVFPGWCGNMDMKAGNFEYICGMLVEDYGEIPQDFVKKTIPMRKYLVFTHKGKLNTLMDTYNYIYGLWLPKSDIKVSDDFNMEWYDNRFNIDQDSSEFDILVPIK